MATKAAPKTTAVQFSVWSVNGGPIDDEVVELVEEAVEAAIFEAFNKGHRLLTQTNKA